jgi:hypothetical protein
MKSGKFHMKQKNRHISRRLNDKSGGEGKVEVGRRKGELAVAGGGNHKTVSPRDVFSFPSKEDEFFMKGVYSYRT